MRFINIENFSPDVEWLIKSNELTSALKKATTIEEKNRIIDANESKWGELKDSLLELSFNKCWYSEAKETYSHYHVDHFRPKKAARGIDKKDNGGYWWLAFDWTNYRVCGGVGNIIKRDKFAVKRYKANSETDPIQDEIIYLLDPTEEEDVLKITFNSNGEIMPIYKKGDWSYEQAEYTIKILNLNFKLLQEARKELWNKCESLIQETQKLMNEDNITPSATNKGLIKERIKQIKQLINPSSEFSTTAKACLESTGLNWAIKIAS